MTGLPPKYSGVADALTPYLVTAPLNRAAMNPAPFGLPIECLVDPMRMESRRFFGRI